MARRLTRCPVCDQSLEVSELRCRRCRTRVRGEFSNCRFCRLAPDTLTFIETFLRCEGNISRVERALSISYPTVRNRLLAALTALGLQDSPEEGGQPLSPSEIQQQRSNILEAVENGTLSAREAASVLQALREQEEGVE